MNYREYLRKIGAEGGKKSRRRLTKKQAREMAQKRWAEVQPKWSKIAKKRRGNRTGAVAPAAKKYNGPLQRPLP